MKVSLLLSNFSRGYLFRESLKSILPQLIPGDEIVVADDSLEPDLEMQDALEHAKTWVGIKTKYFYLNNSGYRSSCYAKNVALKQASNPIIIINDPEVIHITECIKQIKDHLREDPKLFIVPGLMYFPDLNQSLLDYQNMRKIEHCMAPFIGGVLRENLMAVGGWDERFKLWGNDDNDLMYRLGLNDTHHISDDNMVALHQWHERPPQSAIGDANESLLYEDNKSVIANIGQDWGKLPE